MRDSKAFTALAKTLGASLVLTIQADERWGNMDCYVFRTPDGVFIVSGSQRATEGFDEAAIASNIKKAISAGSMPIFANEVVFTDALPDLRSYAQSLLWR